MKKLLIILLLSLSIGLSAQRVKGRYSFTVRATTPAPEWSGLVYWWSLDDPSGTLTEEEASNDATNYGAAYGSTGKVGDCMDFEDDNNEYIQMGTGYNPGSSNFSFTAWIYLESIVNGMSIFGSEPGTGSAFFSIASGGGLRLGNYNIGECTATSTYTVSTGAWYFVVASYNNTANQVTFYINNQSEVESWNTTYTAVTDLIGQRSEGTLGSFDGLIDEPNIWDHALSSSEASYLYNSGDGRAYTDDP